MTQGEILYTLTVSLTLALAALKNAKAEQSFPKLIELTASLTALGSLYGFVFTDSFSGSVFFWLMLGLSSAFIGKGSAQWSAEFTGGLVFSAMALWVSTNLIASLGNVLTWSNLAGMSGEIIQNFPLPFRVSLSLITLCATLAAGDLFLRVHRGKVTFLEATLFWITLPLGLAALFQHARPLFAVGGIESTYSFVCVLLLFAIGVYRLTQTSHPLVFVRLTCGLSSLSLIAIAPWVSAAWLLPLGGFLAAANLALLRNAQADCGILPNTVSGAALTLGPVFALILSPRALASLPAFPLLCALVASFGFGVLRFTFSLSSESVPAPKWEWGLALASLLVGALLGGPWDIAQVSSARSLCLVGAWGFASLLAAALSRNPRYQLNIDTRSPRLPRRSLRNTEFYWLETAWRTPAQLAGSLGAFFALWNAGSIQYGLVVFFCGLVLFFWAALKTQVLW